VGAAVFVVVNTIVDVLYVCFNPEIRKAGDFSRA
jgi:ABC-type dipeptide/oligopeptide/nickel transport system permease component